MSTLIETRETLAAGTWQADPVHSQVRFGVEFMVGTFRGSFSPFEATLLVGESGEASLSGAARVDSIRLQDENLTAHLASPDFFDAERTPEIRFESRDIVRAGDEIVANGELTLRGVTKPVELRGVITDPITDPSGRERIGLRLETTVDRTEFGLNWNAPLANGEPSLSNAVTLTADLYFVKA